jgi:hypothetical protein
MGRMDMERRGVGISISIIMRGSRSGQVPWEGKGASELFSRLSVRKSTSQLHSPAGEGNQPPGRYFLKGHDAFSSYSAAKRLQVQVAAAEVLGHRGSLAC